MKHKRVNWLIGFILLACLSSARWGLAQETGEALLYEEDFERGEAIGWELQPGWSLLLDEGNWVVAGEGHAWAFSTKSWQADYRVLFRLKLIQGSIHLVYRNSSVGRYFISFDERSSRLNKQYYPDTFMGDLAVSDRAHASRVWHQVEIIGQGSTVRFLVDGELEWEYDDPDPLNSGSFDFETLDDSRAFVDDVQVFGSAPLPTPTSDPNLAWVRTGGPLGGLGYDVRMRPDNPDQMYVTDAYAGVFVSEDGGVNWFPSNQGITTRAGPSGDAIPVFCLTIDPHNYDTIWIGTQNVRGIFRSTDRGNTWEKMDNGVVENNGITFRGITIDPQNPQIIYAAAEISSWAEGKPERIGREFDMTSGVVYKSIDGGQNWNAVWRGDNLARYIWVDPRNSKVVYVSTGIFDREAANSDPQQRLPGGVGVLKSTDGGQNWNQVNNGMNNLYVGSLFMHPTNPDILIAGTGNNQYYEENGVYLTTDGGASWQHTLKDENINAVEFAFSNPDIAYAGSAASIYRSQDGGRTWTRVTGSEDGWGPLGVRAGFPIDFQVDPRNPDRIFANEYGGGNFLSTDSGKTWVVASTGYTGAQVRDIAVDTLGRVFAAARSGMFISQDGGSTWPGLSTPPAASMEWYVVAIHPRDNKWILAANNWNGVLLRSQDGGAKWQVASIPAGEGKGWRAIEFAPSDPNIVYAGTSAFYSAGTFSDQMPAMGVYRSEDGGMAWIAVNDSLSQDANVTDLAVSPVDPHIAYAATGNHGLLKTDNGGKSWSAINPGLSGEQVALSVAVHPIESDLVFLGMAFGGIYRSNDGGMSWQPTSAGLSPEATITDVLFDPLDPATMYASDAFSGVYRSTDGGISWLPLGSSLRTRAVNKLAITIDGGHLYAATEGEGVFRLDLLGSPPTVVAVPAAPQEIIQPTPAVPAQGTTSPLTAGAPTSPPAPVSNSGKLCGGSLFVPLILFALGWSISRRR